MISKIENILAFRYLKPKRKEGFLKVISIFSFTGIALGVATLIIVMSVMNGFRAELIDKILGFNAHIVIKPYEKKIPIDSSERLNFLSKEILKTAYSFNGEGVLLSKDNTKGIMIRGYSKSDLNDIYALNSATIIDGSLANFDDNTVSVGKDLSISLNLIVGDKITVMSTSSLDTPFGEIPKQETFVISSVFSSGLAEFDHNIIFMPIKNSILLFDAEEEEILLEIFLKKPQNVEKEKEKIQNLFNNYYVYSWADLNKSFFGALKIERNVMFIILTLIIIVAAFNIVSGLTILVKNKTKEIAILRTLGLSKKSVAKVFFLTGFTIGFFATITGILIGVLFSLYVEEIRIILTSVFNLQLFPEEVYFLSKIPSEININFILIISFFSLFITVLATIFPSLAAAKLDPVKALKYE